MVGDAEIDYNSNNCENKKIKRSLSKKLNKVIAYPTRNTKKAFTQFK